MFTRRTILTTAVAALAVLSSLAPTHAGEGRLNVTVAIPPLTSIVKAIGGDHVAVTVMVAPGTSPKIFEPTPMQMAALESADIYLSVGLPPEQNWTPQVAAARPDMPLLKMVDLVETRLIAGKGKNAGKQIPDPHVWLGPTQLRSIAALLRDKMTELAPQNAADFATNTEAWLARLNAADADARARLAPYAGKIMLVYHPAFGYLADAYGIKQVAIEQRGMEPGPRMIAKVIEMARADNIKVIFVQAQFNQDEARTIAREIGGKVVKLNPLAADPIMTITAATIALKDSFQ